MREACGSPCSALKRPFGTFQCSDRLITEESPTGAFFAKRSISSRFAAFDNAGSLRLPLLRTETPLWDVSVFRSTCGLRGRCGGPAGPPHPRGHKTLPSAPSVRRRVPGRRPGLWRAQRAKAAGPADAAAHLGGAVRTPTGTRDTPSVRLDASRLPLLRTETPLWDVPVFRSAYWRRKPHRGFLRQTLDLQPLCGLRQCGKPAAPLTGVPKGKRDSLQKRESRGENRIS